MAIGREKPVIGVNRRLNKGLHQQGEELNPTHM
jgi:hypothetical protein